MPVLIDEIINVQFFLFCLIFTFLGLWLLIKAKVIHSWVDPAIMPFFQLFVTFFSLSYLSILPINQIIGFLILIVLLLAFRPQIKPVQIVSANFWQQFSYFLIIVVILVNAFITLKKGFIYAADDSSQARLFYYQGFGIIQRINEMAAPVLAINSFYFLRAKKKGLFLLNLVISMYLLVVLGSKGSLLTLIFLYGAYFKFHASSEKVLLSRHKGKLTLLVILLLCTSLGMFYLFYGENFIGAFTYRMISFADGPFYFYYGHLQKWISYSPMYMFDELFVALRIHPDLQYMGLGAKINYYYYDYYDLLNGPNPQIFVESQVLFGSMFWIMYVVFAVILIYLRKMASTPISYYLATFFSTTLFIDSQYAFFLLFDIAVLLVLMVVFWCVRFMMNSIDVKGLIAAA